jgi:hypothetical protein
MTRRAIWVFLAAVVSCAGGTALAGVQKTIPDVPSYYWYRGCGPTAGGMIIGYWDAHGFDNLIVGSNDWNTNQQAIKTMIASPGHDADYWPTPDRKPPPDYHADDCLADFMRASRDPQGQGSSYDRNQGFGLSGYAKYRGYLNSTNSFWYFEYGLWETLVAEIDADRPMELYVDQSGDGIADHFVTVVGYDDTPGAYQYRAYNTYDFVMHWYSFDVPDVGRPYGVVSGATFNPGPPLIQPGDADRDGDVDAADYMALKSNFGTGPGATWEQGDFNRDGNVDRDDLLLLEGNYGQSSSQSLALRGAIEGVPEPATLGLLALGGLALLRRKRRGRRRPPH